MSSSLSDSLSGSDHHFTIACLDCSQIVAGPAQPGATSRLPEPAWALLDSCPHCGSQWLEARYDYEALGRCLPARLAARPYDLWRYRELLPVPARLHESSTTSAAASGSPASPSIRRLSMGEGWTPLIHAEKLGQMLGCSYIYIKDERQGPTASFKDRQAAVSIAALAAAGVREAVLASTGNVAISYSAYAARAGIKLWAFLTSLVPAEKMREVALYGTQVIKVTGTYDQAKQLAAEFARQRGLYLEKGARSIPSVEAMKTIAFEICEQLALEPLVPEPSLSVHPLPIRFAFPDWYFQSVSGGLGPLGVSKGFHELRRMNLIGPRAATVESEATGVSEATEPPAIPAIACIQAEGCAPMAHAWSNDQPTAEPVRSPRTHISTLSTGDPGRTYTLLYQAMKQYGGHCESVTDEESYQAMHLLAKMEGLSVEPAAAVAVAGLIKMARRGQVKPSDVVVINCTGHTLPVEPAILGQGWARRLAFSDARASLSKATTLAEEAVLREAASRSAATSISAATAPEEGLLAALSISAAKSEPFPEPSRIVIVDDNADARRLIRRIIQSHTSALSAATAAAAQDETYQFFEAEDGYEAIQIVQRELPDLIILDLMMPEMDGFAVLDALKAEPQTASIPIIVVTAKELTPQENARLRGQIHSLMQKGEFMNDDLLDEILSAVLSDRPGSRERSG